MTKSDIGEQLAEKTYRELGWEFRGGRWQPPKSPPKRLLGAHRSSYEKEPKAPFRIPALEESRRQSPRGKSYRFSPLYRNAQVLRLLVKKFTSGLNPVKHQRYVSNLDDAARSLVDNIREGYKRPTTRECLKFYGFAQASLEEVGGNLGDAHDDGLLASHPGSSLASIGIELKPTPFPSPKTLLDSARNQPRPPTTSYDPLGDLKRLIGDIKRNELSWEIFRELANKTDWLMNRAVLGLQEKIVRDEKEKLRDELSKIRRDW